MIMIETIMSSFFTWTSHHISSQGVKSARALITQARESAPTSQVRIIINLRTTAVTAGRRPTQPYRSSNSLWPARNWISSGMRKKTFFYISFSLFSPVSILILLFTFAWLARCYVPTSSKLAGLLLTWNAVPPVSFYSVRETGVS